MILLSYIILNQQSDEGGIPTDEKPAENGMKKKAKNPSFKLSYPVSKMIILVFTLNYINNTVIKEGYLLMKSQLRKGQRRRPRIYLSNYL